MKNFIFYILLFKLLISVLSIVPLWNFENSAIDLLSNTNTYTYTICEKEMYDMKIKLEKTIKKGEIITETNKIYINGQDRGETEWEDIESFYNIQNINKKYICPKGKHFMYIDTGTSFEEVIPKDFKNEGDWELQCYYQKNEGFMFLTFLNKYSKIYVLQLYGSNTWREAININNGLYDFKWTLIDENNNHEYPMKSIINVDNNIIFQAMKFTVKEDYVGRNNIGTNKNIIKALNYSNLYFNVYTDNFYFMTYNDISDFICGYFNETNEILIDNIEKIHPIINNGTPLEFIENNFSIKYINFTKNTKYIFYEINNNKNNETLHGIIDVELNKVIFNTNENILKFRPFSNISMLAITERSAYKICSIKNNEGNDCIEKCPINENIILDSENSNKCGIECKTKYTLIPEQICIELCDENIYTIKGTQCGLCKNIGEENKIYKLINTSGCLDTIPYGAEFYNKKLNLLKCKDGYNLVDKQCISSTPSKCYELCESCSEYSSLDNDQKCISCINGYVLQEGNCKKKCSDGYYQNEKKCEKCDDSCKTCRERFNKCTDCIEGKYLNIDNTCKKCSDNCETCSKGEENGNNNCLTCDQSSKYKYLIEDKNNNTCVEICPNDTILIDENKTCILKKDETNNTIIDPDEERPGNSKKKKNPNFFLWSFIILTIIILLIIFICICKKNRNKKKSEFAVIEQIREMEDKEIFD